MFPLPKPRAQATRRPRRWTVSLTLLALALGATSAAQATTYFIRTDGGSAAQCTGTSDAPYPGSGNNQACAWNSLHQALPASGAARINGGDTVYIAPGEYAIGLDAPGANGGRCYAVGAWDCYLPPVPSGPSVDKPTRILGQDPDNPAVLWGNERVREIINLNGSSNVEIGHLEITDKSDCVEFHSNAAAQCRRNSAPYGKWASSGISASNSRNVHLHDLDIHGLANRGIIAGGLTDWTLERVKIVANGWAGWDGDIGANSSNSGNIVMRDVEIGFNGCGEKLDGTPWACWAQNGGGYGDGLGTARTGGHWLIEDSYIHHNTSDGLDLLYMDGASNSSVTVRRTHAVGNAGNQLKTYGRATIENSVVVGNCAYFDGQGSMNDSDLCRALGNTISVGLVAGQNVDIRHNTITGEGDCLILSESGSSSTNLNIQNNALIGRTDWRQAPELTCGHYAYNSSAKVNYAGNLFWNVKSGQCPGGSVCNDPKLVNASMANFDATPQGGSPLVDKAPYLAAITRDFFGNPRPSGAAADIGAVELQEGGNPEPEPVCERSAPTLGLSGSSAPVSAGSTIAYTVTVSNRDSEACGTSTFNLARSVPAGWNGALSRNAVALAPGASTTARLDVTSPASATAGGYGIGIGIGSSAGNVHTRNASATYTVQAPAAVCTRNAPGVSLSGPTAAVPAGTTVRYTLTVANRDTAACASTAFDVAGSVPAGWNVALGQSRITLAAGASTSTTLDVTSSSQAPAGTHAVGAGIGSAVGNVHSASDTATYAVQAQQPPPAAGELEQVLSTDRSTYRRGQTVTMTSRVALGTNVLSGVPVTFEITSPWGARETFSARTNNAGVARASKSLSRWWWWTPTGTWTVKATATRNGETVTDEVQFSVQ
ncbi:hypothetical protein H4F99_02750 [Lysobacter sp. SG-8]|uniref:Alpha-galactosidase NEW3 domain-containing protein n=1 Tax=Marilutibacter penaei TaxID=2759900 RepID=A0A7W3YD52_9GAMM|nr:NEW3 domain-containing protein [Lysobacter penaei]MBB1087404.1 hypothetical protein [Lysobacter penaei]